MIRKSYLLIIFVGFILFTAALPASAQTGVIRENTIIDEDFYGVNFVVPHDPWLSLAWEGGTRVVRWQFNWRDHELAPGEWSWIASDEPIRIWNREGFKIHAILHFPPEFRLQPGRFLVPAGIDLPWDHPDNHWGTYCYSFADRYKGKITSYEIWNEPDLDQYWDGSSREYYQLLKTCYMAIKAADSDATVSMAGMALLIEPNFFPDVVRYIANDGQAAANNHYFDVMAIHMYAAPQLGYDLTQRTRNVLNQYGLGSKPIWITEVGLALRGYGHAPREARWGYGTEEEAAWYLISVVANAIAAHAERVMWFRLADDGMNEAFGMLSQSGAKRPSYKAWELSSSLMVDIVTVSREIRNGIVVIDMTRADGMRIVVMYSETGAGREIAIPAEGPSAEVINSVGEASPLEADTNGYYSIYVPEARGRDFSNIYNYSVGGPPLILLEWDDMAPLAIIEAVVVEGDQYVLVRWQGDDGQFGSGISGYDVEVSENNGHSWSLWLENTTDVEGLYDVSDGGQFLFRVRAIDQSGNVGEFSPHAEFVNEVIGIIAAQIIDMRGQSVPFARVELGDGSLHDADETGMVYIKVPPGITRFNSVDGSGHGFMIPAPLKVNEGETINIIWPLEPRDNLIRNHTFEQGMNGWQSSSQGDVFTQHITQPDYGSVLHLTGTRRPWGAPAAWTTVDVDPSMTDGIISFHYRIIEVGGQVLRLRAVTDEGQFDLWQSAEQSEDFAQVWLEAGLLAGKRIRLVFDLWGLKGAAVGTAEIDNILFANVPVLEP